MNTHDLIYTNSNFEEVGILDSYTLDLSYGADDSNDFQLETQTRIENGALIYLDNTPYGGIIDETAATTNSDVFIYKGRSFHGIIDSHIIRPDAGSDYLIVSGDANEILTSLTKRLSLDEGSTKGLFYIMDNTEAKNIKSYQFTRYCTGYSGIRKMLEANGNRLKIFAGQRGVGLGAVPITILENTIDNNFIDFDIQVNDTVINHLVCLGKGDLAQRTVIDLYADAEGKVSQTQSLFGTKERTEVYEYSNAEDDELLEEGIKKLTDYQTAGSIEVNSVGSVGILDVGDKILAEDNSNNMHVEATIEGVVVQATQEALTLSYTAGNLIVV